MERLNLISSDEEKVFHTILSHEDRGAEKSYKSAELQDILDGLSKGLDFDATKVKVFHEALQTSPIRHLDIVPRNIMKDDGGNFRMIDLERTQIGE